MSALLSTTMRFRGVIGEETGQLAPGQAARRRPSRHPVTEPLEFFHIEAAEAVELLRGEKHGCVALLAADDHGLPLGRVQKASQALLGVSGGNVNHKTSLSRHSQNVYFGQSFKAVASGRWQAKSPPSANL